MEPLTAYIEHPELLTAEVVGELEELVNRNPSFQAARLLWLRGLYQLQDERFGPALRKAALSVPDRRVLFHLLEDEKKAAEASDKTKKNNKARKVQPEADRTQTLIESFLDQMPEMPQPRKNHPVDASVDYMAYLMQQPDSELLPDAQLEDDDDLDEEIGENMGSEAVAEVEDNAPKETQENVHDPYFTETLAHIYIKQGKYTKAIEIIRRLSLNYPKKNRYFADQIRFLEKLIINERYQNKEKEQK